MRRIGGVPALWSVALAACACFLAAQGNPQAKKGAWTLGVYAGDSPLALRPAPGAANPVLRGSDVTDMDVDTLAHPFLVIRDNRYFVFFTAKHLASDKGGIAVAESRDGLTWKFRRTVIREPFVLSHPFVFEWKNEFYLVPEAHTETSVRLYKATSFPDRWQYAGNLLEGERFISPTLARFRDRWWLFTSPSGNETLRLFHSAELMGPWKEHPLSPIVKKDLRTARPAGRPFVLDGALYRLAQDCYPTYGRAVRAFRITAISPTAYAESPVEAPVVEASGTGWNGMGMHHVDAWKTARGRWLAVVDAIGSE